MSFSTSPSAASLSLSLPLHRDLSHPKATHRLPVIQGSMSPSFTSPSSVPPSSIGPNKSCADSASLFHNLDLPILSCTSMSTTLSTSTSTTSTTQSSPISSLDDLFKLNPNPNAKSNFNPKIKAITTATTTNNIIDTIPADYDISNNKDNYEYTQEQIDAERLYFQSLEATKLRYLQRLKDRLRQLRDERKRTREAHARLQALRRKRAAIAKKSPHLHRSSSSCAAAVAAVAVAGGVSVGMEVGVGVGAEEHHKECWRVSSPLSKDDNTEAELHQLGSMQTEKKEDVVFC